MKDTIRKILKEDNQFRKGNYWRQVAKIIVNNIDIDHDSRIISIPFISPWGNQKDHFVGDGGLIEYSLEYDKDYLLMPEITTYLEKYGLQPQRGILMVIIKLIEKGIQGRIDNEVTPLTESNNGKKKFLDIVVKELTDDTILFWDEERKGMSPIEIPWSDNKYRITFHYFIDTLTHPFVWEDNFTDYVVSEYGVPKEDVETIWLQYKQSMNDKFFGGKGIVKMSLTESIDKKQHYIDFIVNDLIKDTHLELGEISNKYTDGVMVDIVNTTLPWSGGMDWTFYGKKEIVDYVIHKLPNLLETKYGLMDPTLVKIIWEKYYKHISYLFDQIGFNGNANK